MSLTLGVVQDTLNQDWILGDSLSYQQDALLDTMATQQGSPTPPLITERQRLIIFWNFVIFLLFHSTYPVTGIHLISQITKNGNSTMTYAYTSANTTWDKQFSISNTISNGVGTTTSKLVCLTFRPSSSSQSSPLPSSQHHTVEKAKSALTTLITHCSWY